jgi:hypothetical protein
MGLLVERDAKAARWRAEHDALAEDENPPAPNAAAACAGG